jgi:chemotaxis protein MotB
VARRRPQAAHANHERWLVSYADFITLLFAFFVVMFASSQTDRAKAQAVSDAVKAALEKGGVPPKVREILGGSPDDLGRGNAQMKGAGGAKAKAEPPPEKQASELAPSMQYLNKVLAKEIHAGEIELHLEPRGLVVSLRQAAFFPSGEDVVNSAAYPSFDKIAQVVRELPNPMRLEGHTDSVPIHNPRFRSNWELSAARSIAVLELLATRYGVPRGRMAIAGYADTVPVASNDDEEGRRHNRRVDLVILNQRIVNGQTADTSPVAEVRGK